MTTPKTATAGRRTRLDRRHRRTVQTALTGAALAVVVAGTAGCGLFEETSTGARAYSVQDKTSAVSVDTDGGDIEIVASGPRSDSVRVKERYEYTDKKPRTEHAVKDGRLSLTADDCGGGTDTCDVSYEVRVPPKTSVQLDTDGGHVTVRGTAGSVDASSDGGGIRIEKSSARQVKAHTEGGAISGRFVSAPGNVDVSSAGGSIDVRLPGGPYAVDASTDGGKRRVSVPVKSTDGRHVKAHTDGGNVTVRDGS